MYYAKDDDCIRRLVGASLQFFYDNSDGYPLEGAVVALNVFPEYIHLHPEIELQSPPRPEDVSGLWMMFREFDARLTQDQKKHIMTESLKATA